MSQSGKGGKFIFGWCLVGQDGEIRIPPQACQEYGFQEGETLLYLHGSWSSGGFSLCSLEKLEDRAALLLRRSIGEGLLRQGGRLAVPAGLDLQSGQRLLCVRGSPLELLFLPGGPVYKRALKEPGLVVFEPNVHCDEL